MSQYSAVVLADNADQLFGTWLFSEVRQATWFLSQMLALSSGRKIRTDTNWHGRGHLHVRGG